ncbi:MAG: 50S ribosomal protein L29 [Patescibacteria group bacterium]
MEIKELREKEIKELNHLLSELRKKLDDLNFKVAQKQLKNVREVRNAKKAIAQILTVLKEKK